MYIIILAILRELLLKGQEFSYCDNLKSVKIQCDYGHCLSLITRLTSGKIGVMEMKS